MMRVQSPSLGRYEIRTHYCYRENLPVSSERSSDREIACFAARSASGALYKLRVVFE